MTDLEILCTFATGDTVEKVWGKEYWLCNNEKYCAKILKLNPGFQCSLHYHTKKDETFFVLGGTVKLQIGAPPAGEGYPDLRFLYQGDKFRIAPMTPHRFSSQKGAFILEVSTQHDDADVTRLEDSREM